MVVRDDQPELIVHGPRQSDGLPPEHKPFIEPSDLSQRTSEPRTGIRGEMRQGSYHVGREVERQWADGSPETILSIPIRAEPLVRLAQPKARVLLEMCIADFDGDRESAATYLGRTPYLTCHAQGW